MARSPIDEAHVALLGRALLRRPSLLFKAGKVFECATGCRLILLASTDAIEVAMGSRGGIVLDGAVLVI